MTTAIQRLTGNALLEHVAKYKDATKTEQCLTAGYVRDNGSPAYVDFYTELLNASPIGSDPNKVLADDDEYDALDDDKRALYDEVHDRFGEKWDHEQIMEFIEELDDIGIEDVSQLEDAYVYTHDDWVSTAEREFAEYWCIEVLDAQIPECVLSAVDWQDVWDHNLRYDFCSIETNNGTFFFRNF